MSTTIPAYVSRLQLLLKDIAYLYGPLPPYDTDFWAPFHRWIVSTLGPTASWNVRQLAELERTAGAIIERSYPHSSTYLKLLFAKLTAIVIIIDDSIDDPAFYGEIVHFSHRLYAGEMQQNPMLALYQMNLKELSDVYGDDGILRGLTITPWISFIDACLIEKDINVAQVSAEHPASIFSAFNI
jgi:hypothetical protein